jgi:SAM-dependent methyltransferase
MPPTSASTAGRPAGFQLPGGSRCGRSHSRAPEAGLAPAAQAGIARAFPDWRISPNIRGSPDVYEIENEAIARAGHLRVALRALAPWDGRVLVDLGCGTGFWLPSYLSEPGRARRVIGVEPDPVLRPRAAARVAALGDVSVVAGSAEHIPLPDASADVVHAMFAYFLSPGGDAGLAEVLRVLRPGGSLVAVDNDYRWGQFAGLLAAASATAPSRRAAEIDAWWRERGATRHEVRSEWRFASRRDLEAVLSIELPARVAGDWLAANPAAAGLSYGYVLFRVVRPAPPAG